MLGTSGQILTCPACGTCYRINGETRTMPLQVRCKRCSAVINLHATGHKLPVCVDEDQILAWLQKASAEDDGEE